MKFKNNASAITRDGKEAGKIKRFVIDPETKEVTHVVIQKGFLLKEEKVTLSVSSEFIEGLPSYHP